MGSTVSLDELANAVEQCIAGAKVVSGTVDGGCVRMVVRGPSFGDRDKFEKSVFNFCQRPGRVVFGWSLCNQHNEGRWADVFYITAQLRQWIGAPPTGAFVAFVATREMMR